MLTKVQKLFKDAHGFSLVELIVTIAIFSVATLGITGALVSSTRSYQRGNLEVDLQQQSQITANLIAELVLDANEVTFDVSGAAPQLKIVKNTSPTTVATSYITQDGTNLMYSDDTTATPELLAERVDTFTVDTSDFATTKNVAVTLGFATSERDFRTTYNMTARNGNAEASRTLIAVRDVVLEPGDTYEFNSISNRELHITNLNGAVTGTTVRYINGKLTITAAKKQNDEFSFRVSDDDGNEDTVHVKMRRVNEITFGTPTVVGQELKAGTKYTLVPRFPASGNKNLSYVANAENGAYDYRTFENVKFEVIDGATLITVNETVENLNVATTAAQCSITFTLNADMAIGDQVVIKATAIRPEYGHTLGKGYGTVSDEVNGHVTALFTLKKSADIRRGLWYDCELPTVSTSCNWDLYRRDCIKNEEQIRDATWECKRNCVPLSDKYRWQAHETAVYRPDKAYIVQYALVKQGTNSALKFSNYDNGIDDDDIVVWEYQIEPVDIQFAYIVLPDGSRDATGIAGQDHIGTPTSPYEIHSDQMYYVWYDITAGASDYIQRNYGMKLTVEKVIGGSWENASGNDYLIQSFTYAEGDTMGHIPLKRQPDSSRVGRYRIRIDWIDSVCPGAPPFSDEVSNKGYIYINVID